MPDLVAPRTSSSREGKGNACNNGGDDEEGRRGRNITRDELRLVTTFATRVQKVTVEYRLLPYRP